MVNDNRFTGLVPDTLTLLTNLEVLTLQYNAFEIDPHWLLEYIPSTCTFEADEDDICDCKFLQAPPAYDEDGNPILPEGK